MLIAVEGEGIVHGAYEGKYLMDDPTTLDELAEQAGAPTLLSLLGADPGTSDWNKVMGSLEGDRWFDPDLALRCFTTIMTAVPDDVNEHIEDWAEGVRWTLEGMSEIARRAKSENKRVHLYGSW